MYKTVKQTQLKRNAKTLLLAGMIIFAATTVLLTRAPSVWAQEAVRTMSIIPPTISHTLNPGDYEEGRMKVINDTNGPLTFSVSVQDYIVIDDHGTPNILPPNTQNTKHSGSAWIGVYPAKFTIQKGEKAELSYYLQVPGNAAPGGHYAAVVFTPINVEGGEGSGSTVQTQVGSLFYITVNGDIKEKSFIEKFFAGGFQEYGPITVSTLVKNEGDVHTKPMGTLAVSNILGQQSYKDSFPADAQKQANVFPDKAREYTNKIGTKWMFGRYKVNLLAGYGKNNALPLTATAYVWIIPWKIITVILLAIVAAFLGMMYRTKKKGPQHPAEGETPTQTPERTV